MTERGFADVAIEAAHAFRVIMQAMARPGRVLDIGADVRAPAPLLPSAAAVALTLCDFQTPVWLSPQLDDERIVHYLRFHAGAPLVAEPQAAQFIFATSADLPPQLGLLQQGTHDYPDRSATLVIQVAGFVPGAVELSGPGIRGRESFGVVGLDGAFWMAMAENHARFPVGIDVIFAAPGQLAAVPRSTAIRMLESA
ncbi:MAG: phosphonate C-P lyase system protein PhnH [Aestuariivirga sp.]|uniref:phosphonate C-P lyase system protein PhnH n=1 Tax=Aestuariivirga sp. TaxID=2650926 RepID=UPI0025BBBC33|nr:phosphonate C-P lyase system protein PhnH [Aestuariivirga sp.]MCA3560309.1 phosphonate C-P lyase system protein PhnH [Aestuariivirga sp.]